MKTFLIILFSLILPYHLVAQILYSQKDVQIINSILSDAKKTNLSDSTIDKIVIHVGKQFLGTPYVGGVLDKPVIENLVIDISELDCVTFLENTVALSLTIRKNKIQFEDFCNELKFIRYRDGIMNGYASRLHYFYDWINNNEKKGVLQNITSVTGGKPYLRTVNSMTVNRLKYAHLKDDSSALVVKKVEEELTTMSKFYLPKEDIRLAEDNIKDGDLIALTTTIEGMEVAHVGIAIHQNSRLHFMHASSLGKKVEISSVPLFDMIKNKTIYTGIIVARLNK